MQTAPPSWPLLWALMISMAVLLAVVGWFVANVANRAADGKIQKNGWIGIRTKATRSRDDAWLIAHQVGRSRTVFGGNILAASGVASAGLGLLVGFGDPARTIVVWAIAVSVLPLVSVVPLVMATNEGDQAARAVTHRRQTSDDDNVS